MPTWPCVCLLSVSRRFSAHVRTRNSLVANAVELHIQALIYIRKGFSGFDRTPAFSVKNIIFMRGRPHVFFMKADNGGNIYVQCIMRNGMRKRT